MKPLQKLLKKDAKFQWTNEGKDALKSIKDAISRSLVLISLDYSKEFQIFSFASEDTIVGVLLQKNKEGQEKPIAFMSRALQHSELKYTTIRVYYEQQRQRLHSSHIFLVGSCEGSFLDILQVPSGISGVPSSPNLIYSYFTLT